MTTGTTLIDPADGAITNDAFANIVDACRTFASPLPSSESDRETGLRTLIERVGNCVRDKSLLFERVPSDGPRIVRLAKEALGRGRVKLQLFAFDNGESHPPHGC